MFNNKSKQIKNLQHRVNELESYVESKKDEEWDLKYPKGDMQEIFANHVWYYKRNNGVVLIDNVDGIKIDSKIVKLTRYDKIVELELLWEYRYKGGKYLSKFIIDTENGKAIKKSCEEIIR